MRLQELTIKRLTYGAEAKIIRTAEKRALRKGRKRRGTNKPSAESYALYERLRAHRLHELRPAARVAHLAFAYLKNRAYATVEAPNRLRNHLTPDDYKAIAKTVNTFGGELEKLVDAKEVRLWAEGGLTLQQRSVAKAVEFVTGDVPADTAAA